MKCVQILSGFVHWDATAKYSSVADIPANTYAPDIQFIDAPDYVFEGWGYDETAEGDAQFIQPTPPEGWLYDPDTGLFYPEDGPDEPGPGSIQSEETAAAVNALLDHLEGIGGIDNELG